MSPTYSFNCDNCANAYDITQSMEEELVAPVCVTCRTSMTRVWSSPTVLFNAKGFYSTGG